MDVDTTVSNLSTKLHIIPLDSDATLGLQSRLVFDFYLRYSEVSSIVGQDAGLLVRRIVSSKSL